MSVFSKPKAADQSFEEYLVIGHIGDLSVVQSPEGVKYYARLDESQQPKGTYIDRDLLHPITELATEVQRRILYEF